jgi:predicted PhzF superfamily epimerase YddE/YHI9
MADTYQAFQRTFCTAPKNTAELSVVKPKYTRAPDALVSEAFSTLGWKSVNLDGSIPPARAYAGAWHLLVKAVADARRLAKLDYDFDRLKTLTVRDGLTALQLVWRERSEVFFPLTQSVSGRRRH